MLSKRVAVTQVIRCASLARFKSLNNESLSANQRNSIASTLWSSCDVAHRENELSFMGYSLRSKSFRYTAYLPFDRRVNQVYHLTTIQPFQYSYEELYDHQDDHRKLLNERELINVAKDSKYSKKIHEMREMLSQFLRHGTLNEHRKHQAFDRLPIIT